MKYIKTFETRKYIKVGDYVKLAEREGFFVKPLFWMVLMNLKIGVVEVISQHTMLKYFWIIQMRKVNG